MNEMSVEVFNIEKDSDLNNPLVSSLKILESNYYHDKMDFEKARESLEYLINNADKLINLYKQEINCELLFYEIIGDNRQEKIEQLYTKELKKYIEITKNYVARTRLRYALASIVDKDIAKAEKIIKEFNKVSKTYPSKGEIESEKEILDYVVKKLNVVV